MSPHDEPGLRDPIPPPVEVALSKRVDRLPEPGALPGGCAYEPKFDGHRLVVLTGPVRLQTRAGRIVTGAFPEIAEAAEALPPGTVLDGELVVWRDDRLDFGALQRRALRGALAPPANAALFDVLALNGTDLRRRPYQQRRGALVELLAPLGPPLQTVPMTTDRDEATGWYEGLAAIGIEGLVIKGRAQPYRPRRRDWFKLRHTVPQDAVAVGFTTDALVVDLGDGPVVSAPLRPAVRDQLPPGLPTPQGPGYHRLPDPLTVEVLQGTGRHGLTTVLRITGPASSAADPPPAMC
jgi:ATP-dependent DNA ligase